MKRWQNSLRSLSEKRKNLLAAAATIFLIFFCLVIYKTLLSPSVRVSFSSCAANGWVPLPSDSVRRVWDTTVINIELDMLEARMHELDVHVDGFIVVESELTFSGKRKDLHFSDSLRLDPLRWARFAGRLRHVVLRESDYPGALRASGGGAPAVAHARKAFQKNQILRGLADARAAPEDLVVFSDLDEVPRGAVIGMLKRCDGYDTPVRLATAPFMYDFGCVDQTPWARAGVARMQDLKLECQWRDFVLPRAVCVQWLRERLDLLFFFRNLPTLAQAGWHMSYFMPLEDISTKVSSNAHTERDLAINHDERYVQCMINECLHLNRRDYGRRLEDPREFERVMPLPEWILGRVEAGDPFWERLFRRRDQLPPSEVDCRNL